MESSLSQFKDEHALLLTEIRRLVEEETSANTSTTRTKELRSILKVVARSFLRERVDPDITEDQLGVWLQQLEAA